MFSLRNQAAKLTNVKPRAELHGQDKKLAVEMSLIEPQAEPETVQQLFGEAA